MLWVMSIWMPVSRRSRSVLAACPLLIALLVCPSIASAKNPVVTAASTPATSVTATSARLGGIVDSKSVSTFHVEVGPTTGYGFATAEYPNALVVPAAVWITLYGLAASTTYHFRIVVTNKDGTTDGPDCSFTTLVSANAIPEVLSDVAPVADPAATSGAPAATGPVADPFAAPELAPPLDPAALVANVFGAVPVLLPEAAKTVVAGLVSGSVSVRSPGHPSFAALTRAGQIPVGSVVDAREGVLELTTDSGSSTDTGRFWGAVFQVSQSVGSRAVTQLTLVGGRPSTCGRASTAARAFVSRNPPGLWGKDHKGHFRTRGRNSVATVRGTEWYVAERCAGTLTRVREGSVSVRDTHRRRTVLVRAGHEVLVRDARRASTRRG